MGGNVGKERRGSLVRDVRELLQSVEETTEAHIFMTREYAAATVRS